MCVSGVAEQVREGGSGENGDGMLHRQDGDQKGGRGGEEEEEGGALLTPAEEKNELEGSPEPSKRSSVSNYRHTHPG